MRLEAALEPVGVELVSRSPDAAVMPEPQPDVVVLDLDALGAEGATRWVALTGGKPRIVGFFSHVDKELEHRALGLGIETFRRGRFWRAAADILEGPPESGS